MPKATATKIRPGYYQYKGYEIMQEWEGDYAGMWLVGPTIEAAAHHGINYGFNSDFFTKREAMADIEGSDDLSVAPGCTCDNCTYFRSMLA